MNMLFILQVHFPSDPMEPGPIYFLTPRKCSFFRVNCEAIPRQINFLTDEAGETGRGANAVISRLHYFLPNTAWGKNMPICMPINAPAKIRIMQLLLTSCGEF